MACNECNAMQREIEKKWLPVAGSEPGVSGLPERTNETSRERLCACIAPELPVIVWPLLVIGL
jgi:hypothetical protein